MRTGIFLSLFVFIFSLGEVKAQKKDVIDSISTYLKTANSRDFAKLFASSVSISIMDEEGQHTRAQSEVIIRNFLSRNKPSGLKELHRLTSNPGFKIAVYKLSANSKSYRVMVSLAESDNKFQVSEIRISEDQE